MKIKHKTIPRVRVGLLYAWTARLVSGYTISVPCKPTLYNPRPLRFVYKPKGLVRRGYPDNTHRLDKLGFSHYDLEVDQLL